MLRNLTFVRSMLTGRIQNTSRACFASRCFSGLVKRHITHGATHYPLAQQKCILSIRFKSKSSNQKTVIYFRNLKIAINRLSSFRSKTKPRFGEKDQDDETDEENEDEFNSDEEDDDDGNASSTSDVDTTGLREGNCQDFRASCLQKVRL